MSLTCIPHPVKMTYVCEWTWVLGDKCIVECNCQIWRQLGMKCLERSDKVYNKMCVLLNAIDASKKCNQAGKQSNDARNVTINAFVQ